MRFRVIVEFDPEADSYSAVCAELPGCTSAGDTEQEARENIEEAIRLYLEPAKTLSSDLSREAIRQGAILGAGNK
jgi:predicted RNase H-like HicB family nuclease